MIIAIPDDYHGLVPRLDCFRTLAAHDARVFCDVAPTADTIVKNLYDAEAIVPIRERTVFSRALLDRLPNLKVISQTGRSAHHVDLAACTERGIPVLAGAHASPYTVAEHTWALILASLRRIPEETALMKRGKWRESFSLGLHGKTLGIFGLGQIGALVAATGASFGMQVLIWGREASLKAAREAGYEPAASKADLFERADVLSVNVRLSKETRGIVTAADLARMKPSALIVNTARAELIAPGALVDALKRGRPGLGAVDVYENEPVLNGEHPLLALPNALCTPHSAWIERTTYELYLGEAFANLIAHLAGKTVKVLNPDALRRTRNPLRTD